MQQTQETHSQGTREEVQPAAGSLAVPWEPQKSRDRRRQGKGSHQGKELRAGAESEPHCPPDMGRKFVTTCLGSRQPVFLREASLTG